MKKLFYVISSCIAFFALLSLSSCNKPGDSGLGDSDIVGVWTVKKCADEIGGEKWDCPAGFTLTFNANGILNIHEVSYVKHLPGEPDTDVYDYSPIRWTKNGDIISLDKNDEDLKEFKILKNTAQELDLMVILEDGECYEIWYMIKSM